MSTPVQDIPVKRIDGSQDSLKNYEGQVLLVVNVASQCGLTPQYEGLQKIHDALHDKGFSVLGFPANNFAGQEPGSNEEIAQFCESKFNVSFPMFEKISVKGEDQHPLYKVLIDQKPERVETSEGQLRDVLEKNNLAPDNDLDVMWNFEKFLISREGEVIGRFAPDIAPDDPKLKEAIDKALG